MIVFDLNFIKLLINNLLLFIIIIVVVILSVRISNVIGVV